jgi:hypothetical protein
MATEKPTPTPQESKPSQPAPGPRPFVTEMVEREQQPPGRPSQPPAAFQTETIIGTGGPEQRKMTDEDAPPAPPSEPPPLPGPPPPAPPVQPFATEDVAKEADGSDPPQPSAFRTESIELDE